MKTKALSLLAGVSVPLIATHSASAGFLGLKVMAKQGVADHDLNPDTPPVPLLVCNVYAEFDRPGEDQFFTAGGTPATPMFIYVSGGTFYQHPFGTDRAPNAFLVTFFPSLAFDTFVTIGVKAVGSAPGNPPGSQFPDNLQLTPGWPGFGPSSLSGTNLGWGVTPQEAQSDPFNPNYVAGNGQVLIGQFSTADGTAISGQMRVNVRSNGVSQLLDVSFVHGVPAPSSFSGGFVINGIDPDDYSGFSVSGAGDVNGDGLADVIVGAFGADPAGKSCAGESYVVFGKVDEASVSLSEIAAGTGGFIINGIDADDRSGFSVSGAGDVNGDGLADVVVGALLADPAGIFYAGETYVVFGKADGTAVNLSEVAAGIGGFVINGIAGGDSSGVSVSGAGDVNGDGLADVVVGAHTADPGSGFAGGESYVVFGKADGTAVNLSDVAAGIGGFVINGIDAYDFSGFSVSGAGDVNGDGLADVVVGAPSANPAGNYAAGESYVVFGKADGTAVNLSDVAAGTGGFVINGIDQGDDSGISVSGAGDVNGDGLADVIVGASGADPVATAGESYVVFGKADGTAVNLSDVAAGIGGFVINGIDQGDGSGISVSGAGDVNGDGLADIIVGADGGEAAGSYSSGESYVVFGKADGTAVNLSDVAAGIGGFVFNGLNPFDYSGHSVSGAGDVNGDGLADVIVGAWKADPAGNFKAGESYVVFSPVLRGDLDGDGSVRLADFLMLIDAWGLCPKPCPPACPGDLDADCTVGVLDFLLLLGNWG